MTPRRRARRRSGLKLRDRALHGSVAGALMSPAGIVAGSSVAAITLASGAHPLVCLASGIAGWLVPVVRAMRRVPPTTSAPAKRAEQPTTSGAWQAAIVDAEAAAERFRSAVEGCQEGPLRDRLRQLEEDVAESLDCCYELADWGAEAESARRELDPAAMERAKRKAGGAAKDAAHSQRELIAELLEIEDDCRTRLTLINGRLDEAVGRAVDLAGRSRGVGRRWRSRSDVDALDGTRQVSDDLRALRAALRELDAPKGESRRAAKEG